MHDIISLLHNTVSFIVVISILVFAHEFGHYIIAKWCGVKIEVFSIGFGRELWGMNDKSGTRWKISSIPLGGYVKMFGDASEASTTDADIEKLSEEDRKKTLYYQPLPKKAAIVVAGPVANFILTIVVCTFMIVAIDGGLPSADPVAGEVVKGSAAEEAGLKPRDRILRIEGEKVDVFADISTIIRTNLGTPVTVELQRGDKTLSVIITPRTFKEKDILGNEVSRPVLGITTQNIKIEDVGLPRAIWESTRITYNYCSTTLRVIGQIIEGKRSFSENIAGPIGIAKMSGQATTKGFATVLVLLANISANLGLINLFPIPPLDGGHLFYYAIEAVSGRPLARKFREYGFRIGFAIIAMLMTYVIMNDIYKWLMSFK